jgi:Glycosyl hydrolase family 3 C-terminal domain
MVLLKNAIPAGDASTALPLEPTLIRTVVVIGGHADAGVISGGGSGSVPSRTGAVDSELCLTPGARDASGFFPACAIWYRSSPVDALKAALPGVTVTYLDGSDQAAAVAAAAAADAAIVVATHGSDDAMAGFGACGGAGLVSRHPGRQGDRQYPDGCGQTARGASRLRRLRPFRQRQQDSKTARRRSQFAQDLAQKVA